MKSLELFQTDTYALKGIAILFVLLGHMGYLDASGAWGVHIFLIVSGYGLYCSEKKSGIDSFWRKRILAVYLRIACNTYSDHNYSRDGLWKTASGL